MMVRTQIMLSEDTHRRAKRRAAERGISLAAYVREAVDHDLGLDEPLEKPDLSSITGLFRSGDSDVSRNIHKYVGEAIEADWKRGVGRD